MIYFTARELLSHKPKILILNDSDISEKKKNKVQ